ncbi:MAG: amino acid ABC transporter ATP-binding protein [Dongiaceae bacterium]
MADQAGQGDPDGGEILRLVDIRKSFGPLEVLSGISLSVRRGEVLAIIGASGSGKSTLLRCVNLLEVPSAGEIRFEGREIRYLGGPAWRRAGALRALRASVGMVFQSYNLWPHKTVLENVIEAPMMVRRLGRREATAEAESLLAGIGLAEKRNEYPSRLSGGQQQRVAIIRALAMKPKIMLFDEVTSALDPELVGEVLDLMTALAEQGMTMLVVTHEMGFAQHVSHRTAFFHAGLIAEIGPSEQVLTQPQNERTRQFLSRVLHRRGLTPTA